MSIMSVVQAVAQVGTLTGAISPEASKKIESRSALLETNGSITRLLTSTVIEPIIIVSDDAYQSEKVESAINLSLDLFSSYYLQAFKILTTLNGLTSQEAIRVLSTKSGLINDLKKVPKQIEGVKNTAMVMSKAYMHMYDKTEKLADKLGIFKEDYVESLFKDGTGLFGNSFHTEGTDLIVMNKDREKSEKYTDTRENKEFTNNYKGKLTVSHDGEKAPGVSLEKFFIKELELKISYNKSTVDKKEIKGGENDSSDTKTTKESGEIIIPITIRAVVIRSSLTAILSLCKPFAEDRSFAARWDDYKSGSISLMNLLFCGDLINEYKKDKLRDQSELSKLLNSRIGQSVSKLATQGMRGFEANYNMLVLSSNDVPKINKYLRGDLFKEKYKEDVLEQAHAIAATILDDDYERMSLLIKDNYGVSTASYRRVTDKTTNQYDAIIEMLNALSAGRNLHF